MTEVMFKIGLSSSSVFDVAIKDPVLKKILKQKTSPQTVAPKPKKVWETPTATKLVEKGEIVGNKPTKTQQPKPQPKSKAETEPKPQPKSKTKPGIETQPAPWVYTGKQIAKKGPISGLWAGIKKYPWEVGAPIIAPIALPAIGYLGYRLLRRSNE